MRVLREVLVAWPSRLRSRLARRAPERGSAVVEFVFLGVLLSLPVFYLVVTMARLQAGAYATTAAAREAGRTFVTAPEPGAASARAATAAALAFDDHGFAGQGGVDIGCDRSPCLQPETRVEVEASVEVALPLVPDFMDGAVPTSVTVSAHHVETVDRFTAPGPQR